MITSTIRQQIVAKVPQFNGKILAHYMGHNANGQVHRELFGQGKPYWPNHPKVIDAQLDLMRAEGIDGVIHTWQGPWSVTSHKNACLVAQKCAQKGMLFSFLLDPGGMTKWIAATPQEITNNVIQALTDPSVQAIIEGDSYLPEKYVLDFGTGANLSQLATTFPSLKFLQEWVDYSWIMIPFNATTYANANAAATMKIPGIGGEFNDAGLPLPASTRTSEAAWIAAGSLHDWSQSWWGGPARVVDAESGDLFNAQLASVNPASRYIAIITWNDYEEQSSGPLEKRLMQQYGLDWRNL